MILKASTIIEAERQLKQIRAYRPYKYGGKWFMTVYNQSEVICFRTKQAIINRMKKKGIEEFTLYILK